MVNTKNVLQCLVLIGMAISWNARAMEVQPVSSRRAELIEEYRKELTQFLSNDQVDVNARIAKIHNYPLEAACYYDELSDLTDQLLQRGARVDLYNELWSSLIHICVLNNRTPVNLEKLALYAPGQGVDFSKLIKVSNSYGFTPLSEAFLFTNISHARFLLRLGENINSRHDDKPVFAYFLRSWLQSEEPQTATLERMLALALAHKITQPTLNNCLDSITRFAELPKYHEARARLEAALRVEQEERLNDASAVTT